MPPRPWPEAIDVPAGVSQYGCEADDAMAIIDGELRRSGCIPYVELLGAMAYYDHPDHRLDALQSHVEAVQRIRKRLKLAFLRSPHAVAPFESRGVKMPDPFHRTAYGREDTQLFIIERHLHIAIQKLFGLPRGKAA